MFSNKIKVFLLTSICLIFFFVTYLDVKSSEVKVIDGDTIHLKNEKILSVDEIDNLISQKFKNLTFMSLKLIKKYLHFPRIRHQLVRGIIKIL